MPAEPLNASYATAARLGTPADATCPERLRDQTLGIFVRYARLFGCLSIVAMLGLLCLGVLLAVAALPVLFHIQLGSWSEVRPECTDAHLATLGNITEAGTATRPPRFIPFGASGEAAELWAADYCTTAQLVFTLCIKGFTFIFSYINLLTVPWRLSIAIEAFLGRPCAPRSHRQALPDGTDFYGRPCSALWFHLPRRQRRRIAALLNLSWIAHYASQVGHLVYWAHSAGQGTEGTLAQNIPFGLSVLSALSAGALQAHAEQCTRDAHPGKFPPVISEFIHAARAEAGARWHAERAACRRGGRGDRGGSERGHLDAGSRWSGGARATGGDSVSGRESACGPECNKWFSLRFWRLLREEVADAHGRFRHELSDRRSFAAGAPADITGAANVTEAIGAATIARALVTCAHEEQRQGPKRSPRVRLAAKSRDLPPVLAWI